MVLCQRIMKPRVLLYAPCLPLSFSARYHKVVRIGDSLSEVYNDHVVGEHFGCCPRRRLRHVPSKLEIVSGPVRLPFGRGLVATHASFLLLKLPSDSELCLPLLAPYNPPL